MQVAGEYHRQSPGLAPCTAVLLLDGAAVSGQALREVPGRGGEDPRAGGRAGAPLTRPRTRGVRAQAEGYYGFPWWWRRWRYRQLGSMSRPAALNPGTPVCPWADPPRIISLFPRAKRWRRALKAACVDCAARRVPVRGDLSNLLPGARRVYVWLMTSWRKRVVSAGVRAPLTRQFITCM